jgi:predicted CoA-binding protein
MSGWTPPTSAQRLAMLRDAKSVAIVGMSADPSKASYFVATYLLSSSCSFDHVWFVNPKGGQILGRPVYRSLAELPGGARPRRRVPPQRGPAVGGGGGRRDRRARRSSGVSSGLHSDDAVEIVTRAGRQVVMNRCLKIEHARFRGGLHTAGFDTGVVSSRRRSDL